MAVDSGEAGAQATVRVSLGIAESVRGGRLPVCSSLSREDGRLIIFLEVPTENKMII